MVLCNDILVLIESRNLYRMVSLHDDDSSSGCCVPPPSRDLMHLSANLGADEFPLKSHFGIAISSYHRHRLGLMLMLTLTTAYPPSRSISPRRQRRDIPPAKSGVPQRRRYDRSQVSYLSAGDIAISLVHNGRIIADSPELQVDEIVRSG
jgi:hypothetical protein